VKKTAFAVAFLTLLAMSSSVFGQLPMLLDKGKPQLVGTPPNPAFGSYFGDLAYFYGDSVTVGFNPTPPQPQPNLTNRFAAVLCTNLFMTEMNDGVAGSQIADAEADAITTNNSISDATVSVWLAGCNDVFWYGTNAAALADNLQAVESLAAWLAIPSSMRVSCTNVNPPLYGPNNSYIYYGPGWQFNTLLGNLAYNNNQANAASFYFSGTTLLIGTARLDSGSGNLIVTVGDYDPVNGILPAYATNIYSCVRTSTPTGPGPGTFGNRAYSPGLICFTNLTANRHYAIVTPQTTAYTFMAWYASYSTNLLPKVVLAGTLKVSGSDYTDFYPAGYTNGSAIAADLYSGMLSNAAVNLSGLGLNVKWVPAPVLTPVTDYFSDGIHPVGSGHQKIETAIQGGF